MEVRISQNDQKESCSVRRDLREYIRVVENRTRMRELQIFEDDFSCRCTLALSTRRAFLHSIRQDTG